MQGAKKSALSFNFAYNKKIHYIDSEQLDY